MQRATSLLGVCFLLLLPLTLGCNRFCPVTGKVTYPDGTPLTAGTVVFTDNTIEAKGPIQSDGTYSLTSINPGDGIPKGVYTVKLASVMLTKPVTVASPDGKKVKTTVQTVKLADPKYASVNSGISCEVKGRTKFDFTVEPAK